MSRSSPNSLREPPRSDSELPIMPFPITVLERRILTVLAVLIILGLIGLAVL